MAISCPVSGCGYSTDDVSEVLVGKLLDLHMYDHSQRATVKGPKLKRPGIDVGVNEEVWQAFERRWDTFRRGSNIGAQDAAVQLFECASDELSSLVLRMDHNITSKSVEEVMAKLHSLAVIPVAKGVVRTELMNLEQKEGEKFRTFSARVKGKAETCGFEMEAHCSCGKSLTVNYATETMRDVLLAGIADSEIRKEALSVEEVHKTPINDLISFVERREMSRDATACSTASVTVSALSSFKRRKALVTDVVSSDQRKEIMDCPVCKKPYHLFRRGRNGWNKKAFAKCFDCFQKGKASQNCVLNKDRTEEDQIETEVSPIVLNNSFFENACLLRSVTVSSHPRVRFKLIHKETGRQATVSGVADTGAQSNLWGLDDFKQKGFREADLKSVRLQISAANKLPLKIIGAFRAQIKGMTANDNICCSTIIYVSSSVSGFYLSFDTMKTLRIVDDKFPSIGGCTQRRKSSPLTGSRKSTVERHSAALSQSVLDDNVCNCPKRSLVPSRPKRLPFTPVPENITKMREWLLEKFGKSTFNTCPHQPLQQMKGPPMEIHVDPSAKPRRGAEKPAIVPLHWQQEVRKDLLRDEALGVIERVPYGVPETWCHRMVITAKHDGKPRRTVDLSPLNRHCKRETYPSATPFHLARRVPKGSWKTVCDAWNGYHSVPLRECDRHLTTFITPFGKWRYKRAPQGFLSSGDGYNRRFGAILSNFSRLERCVDDTVHYDDNLEDHWWRTIDLLITVGSSGVVLNPDKFQFSSREVDFAGFHISENTIEPLPKYINAIQDFPTPTSITDVRSWYGLVNQVSNYAQLRDHMAPFRSLMSPKTKFCWNEELDRAFEKSKKKIIQLIQRGVQIFDCTKLTCLRPDWSKKGIGYFLLQKHCDCDSKRPGCCDSGWKVTLAGSRFLQKAEKNYAPIEGEALAIAWGLEQTRYFTQGCNDLLVVTDHKPLVKIFGDRTLDEIDNTRIFRLKQRTLPWHFAIMYLPGVTNLAADATSRHPSCTIDKAERQDIKSRNLINASISQEAANPNVLSWAKLARETQIDPVLIQLQKAIVERFSNTYAGIDPFLRYKSELFIKDGVIMIQNRVIVPESLKQLVLTILHSAHQGVTAMGSRARSTVFWPGITKDIENTRKACYECNRNAPSQAHLPCDPSQPPTMPFQQIYADYFEFSGRKYLVVGDRFSGWSDIFLTPSGGCYSGAKGLIRCLRSFFMTYGIPKEVSSDGGPEFMSSCYKSFVASWGICPRVSSAYFPRSNGRAEVAVKSAKRLLRSNVCPNGSIYNDRFLRAVWQLRNTPDPECGVSPAQLVFGRTVSDEFAFASELVDLSPESELGPWKEAWDLKGMKLIRSYANSSDVLGKTARLIPPLKVGERCLIQNQHGNQPLKWDRSGRSVAI